MLTPRENEVLEQIARQLREDPQFRRGIQPGRPQLPRRALVAFAAAALCMFAVVAAVPLNQPALGALFWLACVGLVYHGIGKIRS